MAIRITTAGVALTVGIIVLTGLIIGGLFLVKHNGEQARREEAVKIAEQKLEAESGEDVALNEGDKEGESNEQSSNGGSDEATSNSDDTATNGNNSGNSETADELPQTGPAENAAALALGLLTFASIAYYRSRRALHDAR